MPLPQEVSVCPAATDEARRHGNGRKRPKRRHFVAAPDDPPQIGGKVRESDLPPPRNAS